MRSGWLIRRSTRKKIVALKAAAQKNWYTAADIFAGALGVDPDDERSMTALALFAEFLLDVHAIRLGLQQASER